MKSINQSQINQLINKKYAVRIQSLEHEKKKKQAKKKKMTIIADIIVESTLDSYCHIVFVKHVFLLDNQQCV